MTPNPELVAFTDALRAHMVDATLRTPSYARLHPSFGAALLKRMGVPGVPDVLPYGGQVPKASPAYDVTAIGSGLAQLFATGGSRRDNAGVAAAGAVWEALTSVVLNMLFYRSGVIAIPGSGRAMVPNDFLRRFDVFKMIDREYRLISSDLDVLVLDFESLPDDLIDELIAAPQRSLLDERPHLPARKHAARSVLQDLLVDERVIEHLRVVHAACKTNFSDLIQAPMLWSLVYEAACGDDPDRAPLDMVVGNLRGAVVKGERIEHLPDEWEGVSAFAHLSSAFITVPTQKKVPHTIDSMPVLRASAFSAGAFWGRDPLGPSTLNSLTAFPRVALKWPTNRCTTFNNEFGSALSESGPTDDVRTIFHLG